MSTYQRKHGQPLTLYRTKVAADRRGNDVEILDEENPYNVKAWVIPQRSSKAEVPGQQQINVIRIGVNADLDGVTLWSRADYLGKKWDVVTPPSYHHGTRHTRHWSLDLRERP